MGDAKMKKIISYIVDGILAATLLSLVLTIVLELCKQLDAEGVCFVIFLVLAGILISTAIIISGIQLYKDIKKCEFISAVKPLLLNFVIFCIVFLLVNRIFNKEWLIWQSLIFGILLSLISNAAKSIRKK